MREIASPAQLRLTLLRWIAVLVPLVLLLGTASGLLSGSSGEDGWYARLAKPGWTPPGGTIGIVWSILYVLMGLALAIVVSARSARARRLAVVAFVVQFAINLAWSPLFFTGHQVTLAFWWIVLLFAAAAFTTWLFFRVRRSAGLLMLPYLAWLVFAGTLAWQIDRRNPDGETLAPGGSATQIDF